MLPLPTWPWPFLPHANTVASVLIVRHWWPPSASAVMPPRVPMLPAPLVCTGVVYWLPLLPVPISPVALEPQPQTVSSVLRAIQKSAPQSHGCLFVVA